MFNLKQFFVLHALYYLLFSNAVIIQRKTHFCDLSKKMLQIKFTTYSAFGLSKYLVVKFSSNGTQAGDNLKSGNGKITL